MIQQTSELNIDPIEARLASFEQGYTTEDTPWIYFFNEKMDDYPKQGFKLHISATILNSTEVFDAVFPYLMKNEIPFKLIKSNEKLYRMNTNNFGYSQVGKFFTVYTKDTEEAVHLAKALHDLTEEFSSIPIPSDYSYKKGSNIHYRYGIFTGSGEKVDYLEDPDGNLVEDTRKNPVPDWISDPFRPKKNTNPTLLFNRFLIIKVLSQRAKGGVYRVLDFSDKKSLPKIRILKEARAHGEIEESGIDAVARMRTEERALRKLEDSQVAPRVLDFIENEQSRFLLLEESGDFSLGKYLYFNKKRVKRKKEIKLLIRIVTLLEETRSKGLFHGDLSFNNIRISKKFIPTLIDFEHAFFLDTQLQLNGNEICGTPGFYPSKKQLEFKNENAKEYFEAREVYAVGALLLTFLKPNWLQKKSVVYEDVKTPLKTVAKPFRNIIRKACLLSEQRYENISQLKQDLVRLLHDI